MAKATKSEQEAEEFYGIYVDRLFDELRSMNRWQLKSLVRKMVRMYGAANSGAGDPGEGLTPDEADVCLAIANLVQSRIDGGSLDGSDIERICRAERRADRCSS